jgi:hypothetical protein
LAGRDRNTQHRTHPSLGSYGGQASNIEHRTTNIEFEDENEDEDEKEGKRSTSNPSFAVPATEDGAVAKKLLIDPQPFPTGDAPGRRTAFRWVCPVAPGITERLPSAFLHS